MKLLRTGLLFLVLGASACVPKQEMPPPVAQPQAQPRPPVQQPPPPPPAANWSELPLTSGNWIYKGQEDSSQALFGPAGGGALFIVRCDRARREVSLWRGGTASAKVMTVRSSTAARNFPLSVQAQAPAYVWTALPASDRFLDGIVFSRGRFAVEVPGTPMLVIPSWPEPARVLEDCRG